MYMFLSDVDVGAADQCDEMSDYQYVGEEANTLAMSKQYSPTLGACE